MTLRTRNDSSPPDVSQSPETVERYLSSLSGALAAELLEKHTVRVCGLGVFSVRHVPAERHSGKEGVTYHPPVNRIVFERRSVSQADFADMLSKRMHFNAAEAGTLSELFQSFFARSMQNGKEILFPGFGRVYTREKVPDFEPDRSLAAILNSEYSSLEAIALTSVEPESGSARRMKVILIPVIALMLVAVAYLFYHPGGRIPDGGSSEQASAISRSSGQLPVLRQENAVDSLPRNGEQVLLETGEYSVVLGTFRKKESAEREIGSIHFSGTGVFIWPVTGKGKSYYRLAAGRFNSFAAARAWMDSTGAGRNGKAYVQQAKRRVVLHGKEGL